MKCVCGYEHWESDVSPGAEPFIEIVYKHGFSFLPKFLINHKDKECKLFACPKCGTVRMEEQDE